MPQLDLSRIFVRLSKTAGIEDLTCREDFLTECLAATLAEDPELTRAFVALLTGSDNHLLNDGTWIGVETQVSHERSCLDLVLRPAGAVPVAVEIKLDAPEGAGQLAKYLALPERYRVAFLAPARRTIDHDVLAHTRYLRPADGRDHLTWFDVHSLIASDVRAHAARTTLRIALLGLLEELGFAPPVPQLGDLQASNSRERADARQNAGKLLDGVRATLVALGWELQGGDQPGDVWTRRGRVGRLSRVWVGTFVERNRLKVRLYFPCEADRAAAMKELAHAISTARHPGLRDAAVTQTKKIVDKDPRVACAADVFVPHVVLDGLETPDAISECWAQIVHAVVLTANTRSDNADPATTGLRPSLAIESI